MLFRFIESTYKPMTTPLHYQSGMWVVTNFPCYQGRVIPTIPTHFQTRTYNTQWRNYQFTTHPHVRGPRSAQIHKWHHRFSPKIVTQVIIYVHWTNMCKPRTTALHYWCGSLQASQDIFGNASRHVPLKSRKYFWYWLVNELDSFKLKDSF